MPVFSRTGRKDYNLLIEEENLFTAFLFSFLVSFSSVSLEGDLELCELSSELTAPAILKAAWLSPTLTSLLRSLFSPDVMLDSISPSCSCSISGSSDWTKQSLVCYTAFAIKEWREFLK